MGNLHTHRPAKQLNTTLQQSKQTNKQHIKLKEREKQKLS